MKRSAHSVAEDLLAIHIRELGLDFQRQVKFFRERRWRSDFLLTEHGIIIEVEGGTWSAGRHTRGLGFQNDCDKLNTATMMGFRVLRFTSSDVSCGKAKDFLKEWIYGNAKEDAVSKCNEASA